MVNRDYKSYHSVITAFYKVIMNSAHNTKTRAILLHSSLNIVPLSIYLSKMTTSMFVYICCNLIYALHDKIVQQVVLFTKQRNTESIIQ